MTFWESAFVQLLIGVIASALVGFFIAWHFGKKQEKTLGRIVSGIGNLRVVARQAFTDASAKISEEVAKLPAALARLDPVVDSTREISTSLTKLVELLKKRGGESGSGGTQ